jgi:hypothetical protein
MATGTDSPRPPSPNPLCSSITHPVHLRCGEGALRPQGRVAVRVRLGTRWPAAVASVELALLVHALHVAHAVAHLVHVAPADLGAPRHRRLRGQLLERVGGEVAGHLVLDVGPVCATAAKAGQGEWWGGGGGRGGGAASTGGMSRVGAGGGGAHHHRTAGRMSAPRGQGAAWWAPSCSIGCTAWRGAAGARGRGGGGGLVIVSPHVGGEWHARPRL